MASKIKVDQLETADGTGTIALQNQLSGMTSASMPSGHLLQTVESGTFSNTVTTSDTFIDSNCTVNITPSATSNTVHINFTVPLKVEGASTALRMGIKLVRVIGGTTTTLLNTLGSREHFQTRGTPAEINTIVSSMWVDSPNTTSQVTYKLQLARNEGTAEIYGSGYGGKIIAQEIKA